LNRDELKFRNILGTFDEEFSDYLADVDYDLIKMDGLGNINPFKLRRDYWAKPIDEVTINPNANLGNTGEKKSFVNQITEVNNPIEKLSCYYLYRRYANRRKFDGDTLIKDVFNGALYIHNSTLFALPYCIGLSTSPLLFGQVQFSDVPTLPPKRPSSFTNLTARLIQTAANCFAGATALTDFFVNYSYFTKKAVDYDDQSRLNDMQNLVHGVSDRERLSGQSPFSNVSILSPETMRSMFADYFWMDSDYKIADLVDETMRNQMIFLEFLAKGMIGSDKKPLNLPYRFPITTFIVDPSMEKEYPDEYNKILVLNKDFCFLNILRNMSTDLKKLSMCCKLTLSLEDMLKMNINNTFGSYLTLGSHAVVTVNLGRIALEARGNWDEFERILIDRVGQARQLLIVHRRDILGSRRIKYHEFFKNGMLDLDHNFFSTIGFVGFADAIEYMGGTIMEGEGLNHGLKFLDLMKQLSVQYSHEDNAMYNLEEVPAESASGVLAAKDKIKFPRVATKDFYNSQFVPLSYDVPIVKRIEVESKFQNKTTGGSMAHLNILGSMDEINGFKLQDRLIKNTDLVQFAMNRGFTLCKNGHNSMGVLETCPVCGSKDLDWMTRIVGYFVNVSSWNKIKQLEFHTRQWNNWDKV
jgi:ribonucleoside-triphosphate reductase